MNLDDILHHLEALDTELVDIGFQRKVQILVVGDVYMLAHFQNRTATQDIDACVFDPAFYEQEYNAFKNLIHFLAQDRHLHPD